MKASKIPKYLMVTTGTMHPTDDSLAGDTDETIDDVVWYPSYFMNASGKTHHFNGGMKAS